MKSKKVEDMIQHKSGMYIVYGYGVNGKVFDTYEEAEKEAIQSKINNLRGGFGEIINIILSDDFRLIIRSDTDQAKYWFNEYIKVDNEIKRLEQRLKTLIAQENGNDNKADNGNDRR